MAKKALVWFRADLRVDDNRALATALREADGPVAGVFLLAGEQWHQHDWADIKVHFLLENLRHLSRALEELGVPLLIRKANRFADAPAVLTTLAEELEIDGLYYNKEYEVNEARRDSAVDQAFEEAGRKVSSFHDQVILPPESIKTKTGGFYGVFTPYKRAWISRLEEDLTVLETQPLRRKGPLPFPPDPIPDSLAGFALEAPGHHLWNAGEAAARRQLEEFIAKRVRDYKEQRDIPSIEGTSKLSPYLALGVVSPRTCLKAAMEANNDSAGDGKPGPSTWISEIIWREFYRHVMVGHPRVSMNRPYQRETERIVWREDEGQLNAWQEGRTGYPIVDAAMRQLNATGWMHNRLRMITAMFLSKDLFLDWRLGERYFMRRLIDGDLASNNGGWQWSASTGTDAAPYFRIFNPTSQGERFDPKGEFIRRWVPELKDVKGKAIHQPHESGKADLFSKKLDYPEPIVDHKSAREHAIKAFQDLKG